MAFAAVPLPLERSTVWSAGPCPDCGTEGALLVLRRREDGLLLLHCPPCGLTLPHGPEAWKRATARSRNRPDPGSVEAATTDEIRAADLSREATPWYEGDLLVLLGARSPTADREPPPKPHPWWLPARGCPTPAWQVRLLAAIGVVLGLAFVGLIGSILIEVL